MCHYSNDELLVRYFDNGKRCEDRVPYVPRLYVPTKGKLIDISH